MEAAVGSCWTALLDGTMVVSVVRLFRDVLQSIPGNLEIPAHAVVGCSIYIASMAVCALQNPQRLQTRLLVGVMLAVLYFAVVTPFGLGGAADIFGWICRHSCSNSEEAGELVTLWTGVVSTLVFAAASMLDAFVRSGPGQRLSTFLLNLALDVYNYFFA